MKNLLPIFALLIITVPTVVFGQEAYRPLINLPATDVPGFEGYINLLYAMSISVAALLAVIKIIIAGLKYMLSDVVTNKGDAIKDIKGALLGLLLILGAVIILNLINPQLTKTSVQFKPAINSSASDTTTGNVTPVTFGNVTIVGNVATTDLSDVPLNRRSDAVNQLSKTCQGENGKFKIIGSTVDTNASVSCTVPATTVSFDPESDVFDSSVTDAPKPLNASQRSNLLKMACRQRGGTLSGFGKPLACYTY